MINTHHSSWKRRDQSSRAQSGTSDASCGGCLSFRCQTLVKLLLVVVLVVSSLVNHENIRDVGADTLVPRTQQESAKVPNAESGAREDPHPPPVWSSAYEREQRRAHERAGREPNNYLRDYDWKDLPGNIRTAASILGFDRASWDADEDSARSKKPWDGLTQEQKQAAMTLGYDLYTWDASTNDWRAPGKEVEASNERSATELVAYGIGGVIPYFGKILPTVKFDLPFSNKTTLQTALVPNLSDLVLDVHECRVGRKTKDGDIVKDGYYNACFEPKRKAGYRETRDHCYRRHVARAYENRIHRYPAAGHELWSCSDLGVMEQLVAAQVLDYLIIHRDRFYKDKTNNLFFLKYHKPIQLVSIDHHGASRSLLYKHSYKSFVILKVLLDYEMPRELLNDIKRVRLQGSKEDFVQNFNTSLRGQLDNLITVFAEYREGEGKKVETSVAVWTDLIWQRMKSVLEHYNHYNVPLDG